MRWCGANCCIIRETTYSQRMKIGGYTFTKICSIKPMPNADETIKEFMPQSRYKLANLTKPNKYGSGPFCKFNIPKDKALAGVYAIVSVGSLKYIGECKNLSSRYNNGYGNISPRNCFVGGQETNCRVNNLILIDAKKGADLALWLLRTENYKQVERELLEKYATPWNRRSLSSSGK